MNFKQLVCEIIRPIWRTCLDHILINCPQRIHNIVCPNIGLSEPVFAVRQYSRTYEHGNHQTGNVYIRSWNMKDFNEDQFKSTPKNTSWEEIDDIKQ